jgi:hypothetical protein
MKPVIVGVILYIPHHNGIRPIISNPGQTVSSGKIIEKWRRNI